MSEQGVRPAWEPNSHVPPEASRLPDARLAQVLAQVSREALLGEGLDDVLQRIVDCVVRRLPVSIASIVLLDEAGTRFLHETWAGDLPLAEIDIAIWDVSVGVAGRCARTGKPQLIHDVASDPDYVAGNPAVRSEYVLPIRHRGRLHGVLNIESTEAAFFTPETCAAFDAIAHQVAGAIHLARVVGELEAANQCLREAATRDGLTGLSNRSCFGERLEAACERARRDDTPLSLLLVDVDCFKQLNDVLGHLRGDECLRRLGVICREYARGEGALVARYGGDELVLLLPGLELAQAMAVAERLRQRVEDAAMAHPTSVVAPWLTISVGVFSVWAGHGSQTAARLLAGADRALHAAKVQGRNRVADWQPRAAGAECADA